MLKVSQLTVNYGAIEAVRDLSFEVKKGQVVAIIGANGAGKSTTLNTIGGILKPKRGRVEFDGRDITGLRADKVVGLGLAQVPEGREVLATLSVEENLLLGAYTRKDTHAIAMDLQTMFDRFPILQKRRKQPAGLLSGGEQQMLVVARALMGRPKLLTLDEPSMGLAPLMVKQIFEIILEIKAQGVTLLIVEQNANLALQIAHDAYVLESGSITLSGPASEIASLDGIRAAYLGV